MRKFKYLIGILLLFLIVGFATISVTLSISGNANVISNLERGYKLPSRDNLFKIVVALNISLDKHLAIKEIPEDGKMTKIVEKYHELPLAKQIALENIIWATIENINELK